MRRRFVIVLVSAGVLLGALIGFNLFKAHIVRQIMAKNSAPPQVVTTATAGYSDRDIAQALFITTNTVEVHLTATYHKLGINGRADLGCVSLSR